MPFAAAYGVTFYSPQRNAQEGKVFDMVEASKPYVIELKNPDIAITKLIFTINRSASNAGITVYHLGTIPQTLPVVAENDSYQVDELKYVGFVPFDTTRVVYDFKVAKGWLENMSVSRESIALHVYDQSTNSWQVIGTKITKDDSDYVYYSAEAKGFHYLLIGKSQTGALAASEVVPEEKVTVKSEEVPETQVTKVELNKPVEPAAPVPDTQVTKVDLNKPVQPAAPAQPVAESSVSNNGLFTGGVVILAIAILAVVLYFIFGTRPVVSTVDKELNNYIKESLTRGKTKEEVRNRLLEVGWHHERVDKVMSKHKDAVKPLGKPEVAGSKKL
jgi:PGF-pre-PGF domain-containing protein